MNGLKILIPDFSTLANFEHAVESFFAKIGTAEQQNIAAREARDRLLPKLMSGEIGVA